MLFRFMLFCSICFVATLTTVASSEINTFPTKLEGKWEQIGNDEKGDIQIIITKKEGDTIHGVMTLTGSRYCKDPIPFQGKGANNTAHISGDAPVICGFGGKLTGEVSRVSSEIYRGNFSYKWFGITWAKGTFELVPAKD
jgi:hypothetical protein